MIPRPARVIDIGAANRNLRTPPPTGQVVHGAHTPVTHSGPPLGRRQLLKELGLAGSLMALGAPGPVAEAFRRRSRFIPAQEPADPASVRWGRPGEGVGNVFRRRPLGPQPDDGEAIRLLHEAIDAGMTFLDNAWEYNGGRAKS